MVRFAWLEQLVENGSLTKEARDRIYRDCGSIVKEASSPQGAEALQKLREAMLQAVSGGVALGIGAIAGKSYDAFAKSRQIAGLQKELLDSKKKILEMPDFAADPAKAEARFNEIAKLAPHVAMSDSVMPRLMKRVFESGLSDDDADRLALLQAHHQTNSKEMKQLTSKLGSAQLPLETAGSILADVYCITKTAAPELSKTRDFLRNYFHTVASIAGASLLGGVATGAVTAAKAIRDKKVLEKALNESFTKAIEMSDPESEPLHQNKEKAREAFLALAHFAPHVAMQPQAARAFMSKTVAYDQGMHVGDIKDLTQIESNMGQYLPKASPFMRGLAAGSQALGLGKAVERATDTAVSPFSDLYRQEMNKELKLERNLGKM